MSLERLGWPATHRHDHGDCATIEDLREWAAGRPERVSRVKSRMEEDQLTEDLLLLLDDDDL